MSLKYFWAPICAIFLAVTSFAEDGSEGLNLDVLYSLKLADELALGGATNFALSQDGSKFYLAADGRDVGLRGYDLQNDGAEIFTLPNQEFETVEMSPKETYLVLQSDGYRLLRDQVQIIEAETGHPVVDLTDRYKKVALLAWHPDETQIAILAESQGSEVEIIILNVGSWSERAVAKWSEDVPFGSVQRVVSSWGVDGLRLAALIEKKG